MLLRKFPRSHVNLLGVRIFRNCNNYIGRWKNRGRLALKILRLFHMIAIWGLVCWHCYIELFKILRTIRALQKSTGLPSQRAISRDLVKSIVRDLWPKETFEIGESLRNRCRYSILILPEWKKPVIVATKSRMRVFFFFFPLFTPVLIGFHWNFIITVKAM